MSFMQIHYFLLFYNYISEAAFKFFFKLKEEIILLRKIKATQLNK
jgi:hypothetical protein